VRSSRRRAPARVVTLSEGGFAIVTDQPFEQGDAIRVLLRSGLGGRPIPVSGIVWNERGSASPVAPSSLRRLGCVVSQPPQAYMDLLDRLAPPPTRRSESVPVAVPRPRDIDSESVEVDLPRSRDLQPPPKREPEETLPYFRIRMKQIGGPRTRILTLRARSATQAEALAHDELAKVCKDASVWGILHIARISSRG
jgi:hypothetical protein